MRQDWEYRQLDDVCSIDYGTRVVQKNEKGSTYFVYGGGGATFKVDRYNREDSFIVSRFAMSPKCTRFVSGKFFLNDSGLSVSTKDNRSLRQSFVDKALLANNDAIYAMGKGVAQKNLDMPSFRRLQIPIPPIAEQEKIVAELDCLTGIIEKKKQQLEELNKLAQSIFYDMFGDPITNEKGWETSNIGSFCTDVRYGTSRPACDGGKYTYLRMGNLTYEGSIDLTDIKRIDIPDNEIEKCIVRKGDVLFNRTNSLDLVGKTCLFDLDEEMVIAGYIIRVRLNRLVLPVYLVRTLNTSRYKKVFRNLAKGAVNQANINAKEFQSVVIPVPPLSLQNEFAQKVEAIEKQKELVKRSIVETETLFNSRMDFWFN